MKFRYQMLLLFLPISVASVLTALFLFWRQSDYQVQYIDHAKALSIATTVAASLDPEAIRAINTSRDEESLEYKKIKSQLDIARRVNRRDDTWVQNIYTVFESTTNPGIPLIGVDPESDPSKAAHIGEPIRFRSATAPDWDRPWAAETFIEDQFGTWMEAISPIQDNTGARVGSVVVEIPAYRLERREAALRNAALQGLLIGGLLGVLASLLVSRIVSRPLETTQSAVEKIAQGDLAVSLPATRRDEFGSLERAVNIMVAGLKERQTVKSAFARYVSHQVMDVVLRSGTPPAVIGERRKVTILFSDIRGFTTAAERLAPELVVELLNQYFERMVEIIFKYDGTLDKFIGDGVMVIFGAPTDDSRQEEKAVGAAIEMLREVSLLSAAWKQQYGIELRIGIGINTGNAIVGNVGSSKRLEYTAIGDTVNLASRLQAATKEQNASLLFSEFTFQGIRGVIPASRLGAISIRGKSEPVTVYTADIPECPTASSEDTDSALP